MSTTPCPRPPAPRHADPAASRPHRRRRVVGVASLLALLAGAAGTGYADRWADHLTPLVGDVQAVARAVASRPDADVPDLQAASGDGATAVVASRLSGDSPVVGDARRTSAARAADAGAVDVPTRTTHPSGAQVDAGEAQRLESVDARTIPALTNGATTAPAAGSGVRATPAVRARHAAELRASRAARRARLGAAAGYARPVEGAHKTSGYGPRWGRMHRGIDYAGPVGLPIRTVAAGTVTIAESQRGYGKVVEVQHEDGGFTRYAHLDLIRVELGQRVEPAHIIGALGNSGRSTGPHLHFEVRTPAGTPVDPEPWLRNHGILPVDTPPGTREK